MSDEATIAASSLLTSLLGTAITNSLPQRGELNTAGETLSTENPSAFEQVLVNNFDASVDSTPRSDIAVGAGAEIAGQHLAHGLPERQQSLNLPGTPLSSSPTVNGSTTLRADAGNSLPATGEQLPISEIDAQSREFAGQYLSQEFDAVDKPANLRDEQLSESQLQSDSNLPELTAAQDAQPLSTPATSLAGSQTTNPAVPTQSSAPDQSTPRNLSSGIQNTSAVSSEAAFGGANEDANLDFGDGESPADGSDELPVPLRGKEQATAHFAQVSNASEELLNTNQFSARGPGESLTGLLATTSSVLPNTSATPSTTLALATDKNLAGAQVAQALTGFIRQGDDNAEINLSPPHLGKISVRIAVQNEQVSVVVTSPMAEVREVIEASLPRLSELLSEAGLSLGDASVFDQNTPEQNKDAVAERLSAISPTEAVDDTPQTQQTLVSNRLIDAYA